MTYLMFALFNLFAFFFFYSPQWNGYFSANVWYFSSSIFRKAVFSVSVYANMKFLILMGILLKMSSWYLQLNWMGFTITESNFFFEFVTNTVV